MKNTDPNCGESAEPENWIRPRDLKKPRAEADQKGSGSTTLFLLSLGLLGNENALCTTKESMGNSFKHAKNQNTQLSWRSNL